MDARVKPGHDEWRKIALVMIKVSRA